MGHDNNFAPLGVRLISRICQLLMKLASPQTPIASHRATAYAGHTRVYRFDWRQLTAQIDTPFGMIIESARPAFLAPRRPVSAIQRASRHGHRFPTAEHIYAIYFSLQQAPIPRHFTLKWTQASRHDYAPHRRHDALNSRNSSSLYQQATSFYLSAESAIHSDKRFGCRFN